VGKERGKKIVGFPERDGGGVLTERSIRKAENGLPPGFSQLSKERASMSHVGRSDDLRHIFSQKSRITKNNN